MTIDPKTPFPADFQSSDPSPDAFENALKNNPYAIGQRIEPTTITPPMKDITPPAAPEDTAPQDIPADRIRSMIALIAAMRYDLNNHPSSDDLSLAGERLDEARDLLLEFLDRA